MRHAWARDSCMNVTKNVVIWPRLQLTRLTFCGRFMKLEIHLSCDNLEENYFLYTAIKIIHGHESVTLCFSDLTINILYIHSFSGILSHFLKFEYSCSSSILVPPSR